MKSTICLAFLAIAIWATVFVLFVTRNANASNASYSVIYEDESTRIYKVTDGPCDIYVASRPFGGVAMQLGQGCK